MSEETSKPATSGNHDGFEREDLNAKAVFAFLIGLAVICVLSYFILIGVYHYLDVYQRANQPPQNPLVAAKPETGKPTRAETKAEIKKDFPEPLLEEDEGGQLDSDRVKEEQRLNSYGWADPALARRRGIPRSSLRGRDPRDRGGHRAGQGGRARAR
ncbi:MAG: hypothetical protein LAN63_19295 [Acidobacteriia bacterium]|nr:hypothetical protein [Terriglobia bacterium]